VANVFSFITGVKVSVIGSRRCSIQLSFSLKINGNHFTIASRLITGVVRLNMFALSGSKMSQWVATSGHVLILLLR